MSLKPFKVAFYVLCLSTILVSSLQKETAFDEANSNSIKGLEKLPRGLLKGLLCSTVNCGESNEGDYAIGVIDASALFLVFVILSPLLCILWCPSRTCCKNCCCKSCCKQKKRKKKMGFISRWSYLVLLLLSSILMVVFSAIAYDANIRFSDAIVNEESGVIANGQELMENTIDFIDGTVYEPLLFVKNYSINAINRVNNLLQSGSDIIIVGSVNVTDTLEEFNDFYGNKQIIVEYSGVNYTFDCGLCLDIPIKISEVLDFINSTTDPIFHELNDTFNAISEKLFDVNDTLHENLKDFQKQLDDVLEELEDRSDTLEDDIEPQVENANEKRELAYNILFVIPLIPIIFVILGMIFRKGCCFTISYILMWCSCTIMFFMLVIHLPMALVLNDGCNELDIIEANATDYFGGGETVGKLITACLNENDSRIAKAFGIDDDLSFIDINFPNFTSSDVVDSFDYSQIGSLEQAINETTIDTFYGNVDDILKNITELIEGCSCPQSSDIFDRSNLSLLNSTNYYSPSSAEEITLDNYKNDGIDYIMAEQNGISMFNETTTNMRDEMYDMLSTVNDLRSDVIDFLDKTQESETILDPLIEKAEWIISNSSCGFVGDSYRDVKSNVCDIILPALSTMVMCMLLIGIFSIISCCSAIKMVRRINPLYDIAKTAPMPTVVVINGQQASSMTYPGSAIYAPTIN